MIKKENTWRPLVYICSPYSGDTETNTANAIRYSRFAVDSGAIALAPHLLLPQYMYNSFGNDFFSTKMLVATLSYTENVAKAVLHSFRLLRILDCHKDGVNMYQFCVNPEDNPECFEPAA